MIERQRHREDGQRAQGAVYELLGEAVRETMGGADARVALSSHRVVPANAGTIEMTALASGLSYRT